jgi:hypothetical protein
MGSEVQIKLPVVSAGLHGHICLFQEEISGILKRVETPSKDVSERGKPPSDFLHPLVDSVLGVALWHL